LIEGLGNKLVHPKSGEFTQTFIDRDTSVNINLRKEELRHQILYEKNKKSTDGWFGRRKQALVDARIKALECESEELTSLELGSQRNLKTFLDNNPEISKETALEKFAINGVDDVLGEHQYSTRFAKQLTVAGFLATTGFAGYQFISAFPGSPEKSDKPVNTP
jgi:hypothetical protein